MRPVAKPTFDEVVQSFHRAPDRRRAVELFEEWLSSTNPSVIELHAFCRMAMVDEVVRSGIAALRENKPKIVDLVLEGFANPEFPRVGEAPPSAESLDLLWVEYFVTGSLAAVQRIVGVLDEPDLVRTKLAEWLTRTRAGLFGRMRIERFVPVFARCAFPVELESTTIGGPLDLDLSVALAARAGKLKFTELPVPLANEELLRIAAKSAAVWSLRAIATTHPEIAQLCEAESQRTGGAGRLLLRAA